MTRDSYVDEVPYCCLNSSTSPSLTIIMTIHCKRIAREASRHTRMRRRTVTIKTFEIKIKELASPASEYSTAT
jgi:hypothetical protein